MYEHYVYTISMLTILLYLIHGDYPSRLLNHNFIFMVTRLLIPIPLDLDVQTKKCCPPNQKSLAGVIWITLPRLPVSVYMYKNYTPVSSSSCLFIQILKSGQTTSNTQFCLVTTNVEDFIGSGYQMTWSPVAM